MGHFNEKQVASATRSGARARAPQPATFAMVSDDGQFRLRNGRRPVLTMRVHMDDEQHGHLHPIEDK